MGQIRVVLFSLIFGVILGMLYDIFRMLRTIMKTDKKQTFLFDVVYLIICGFLTFIFAMTFNFGEVRFYIIGAEILGGVLYYFTVGEFIIRIFYKVFFFIEKIIGWIKIKIISPIFLCIKLTTQKLINYIKSLKIKKKKVKLKINLKADV